MKNVKNKLCFTSLIAMSVMLVTSIVSLTVGVFDQLQAAFDYDPTSYYAYTSEDNQKFRCYVINDEETGQPTHRVCIAWFYGDENNPQNVPTTIKVPEKVTLNEEEYEVVGIIKGGFRSLSFTTIELPDSIQEIGEEAFAYCLSMTSFTIPYQVSKIAPSTFMDCQNLELFYYTGIDDENQGSEQSGEGEEELNIVPKLGNETITEIGDHAFDNCKKLKGLYFPTYLETIGNSAFQRCELLQSLFFPGGASSLTVGAYAFADCPILKSVYFETNLTYVGPYAFANCKEDLEFTYTGSTEPTTFAEHWRDKNTTTANDYVYNFVKYDASPVVIDPTYPGLIYSFETSEQYLDSAHLNRPAPVLITTGTQYVKINGFQEPFTTPPEPYDYYNVETKKLTLPDKIKNPTTGTDWPVKVIGSTAFAGSPVRKVEFNKELVQIQTRAFWGCTLIDELDFKKCKNLKEISYEIFQSPCPELQSYGKPDDYTNKQVYNVSLHEIKLPACLEYIGDSAFFNFAGITQGIKFTCDSSHPSLKVIGDFAFAVHRSYTANQNKSEGLMDLVLPNTLDDRYVTGGTVNGQTIVKSNYYHPYTPSWKNDHSDTLRKDRYAVGRFCFENQDMIGTCTMEPATPTQASDNYHTTSFLGNSFCRCDNLRKFKSNKNLYLIGTDSFKLTKNLKELFLYSEKAQWHYTYNNGAQFPWGIMDNANLKGGGSSYDWGIFASGSGGSGSNEHPDTVIYVSGSSAPGWLDMPDKYKSGTYLWNRDQTNTFLTGLQSAGGLGTISNKKQIPTFYNCVWEGSGINVLYWKPTTNTFKPLNSAEYTLSVSEYNDGYIAIAPAKEDEKYSIARYFSDGKTDHFATEIDLTNIPTIGTHTAISDNLVEIAGCAFATNASGRILGRFFILPNSLLRIGERAFFRRDRNDDKNSGTDNENAVGIVTYRDENDVIKVPSSDSDPTHDYDYYKTNYNKSVGGYCVLPPNLTRIEANSFFNNNFRTIDIGKNVTYLGASAFTVSDYINKTASLTMQTDSEPLFASANDGIYYTKDATKKMLVYQTGGTTSDDLVIDTGTKAIGFRAAVRTNYKKITFPNGVRIIYGSAFHYSRMEEIDGDLSTWEYINARTANDSEEVYDDYSGTLPFDNYDVTPVTKYANDHKDYLNGSRAGAFKGCSNLKTIDFSDMSSLKVIGQDAFRDCSNLQSGSSKTYEFYNYVGKGTDQPAVHTTYDPDDSGGNKIVDLSNSTNLTSIKTDAFNNDKKIVYTILPNTTNRLSTGESTLTLADNANVLPPSSTHLIGDTYHQAGIVYNDNNDIRKKHYPNNALRNSETYNFYRFYVVNDTDPNNNMPSGMTIDNYLANNYDQSIYNVLQYWTIYEGNYYLFKGYDQAKAFYDLVAGGKYTTPGQALTLPPDPTPEP